MVNAVGTASVAKRSLGHFAVGRVVSALIGVSTLLLMVRIFGRSDYGLYIALMAAFEILQLAASPGAYALVFRYLPELRAAAAGREMVRLMSTVSIYRFLTIALVAMAAAIFSNSLADTLGAPGQGGIIRLYSYVLVFEGMARFIDAAFESLLLQGMAQISILIRNGTKLAALVAYSGFATRQVELIDWLPLEALTTGFGLLVSCVLLGRHLIGRSRGETTGTPKLVSLGRVIRFTAPMYLSQVLYLASGPDMVKLLFTKLVGAGATAAFGFASALAGTVQRYLPSFLLIGWVRPLFIAARTQGKSTDELVRLAGTVVKLNLLMLAPILTVLYVAGEPIVKILAGGRLPESLPFINFFMLLVAMQSVRGVISLLGMTLEVGSGSLVATLVSLAGLASGLLGYRYFGIWSLCIGLMVSETLWAGVMVLYLRSAGLIYRLPMQSIMKFAVAVAATSLAGFFLVKLIPVGAGRELLTLACALLSGGVCLLLLMWLRPFEVSERAMINRLLPAKLFMW